MTWKRLWLPTVLTVGGYAAVLWLLCTPGGAARLHAAPGHPVRGALADSMSAWFRNTAVPAGGSGGSAHLLHLAEDLRPAAATLLLLLALLVVGRTVPPYGGRWFGSLFAAWGAASGAGLLALAATAAPIASGAGVSGSGASGSGASGGYAAAVAAQLDRGMLLATGLGLLAAVAFAVLGRIAAISADPERYAAPHRRRGNGYRPAAARAVAGTAALVTLAWSAAASRNDAHAIGTRLRDWSVSGGTVRVLRLLLLPGADAGDGAWTWTGIAHAGWHVWLDDALAVVFPALVLWLLLRRLTGGQVRRGAGRVLVLAMSALAFAELLTALAREFARKAEGGGRSWEVAAGRALGSVGTWVLVLGFAAGLCAAVIAWRLRDRGTEDEEDLDGDGPFGADASGAGEDTLGGASAHEETVRFARPRRADEPGAAAGPGSTQPDGPGYATPPAGNPRFPDSFGPYGTSGDPRSR